MPRALITGISGQDGSYLADLLLSKGYEVHGLIRPSSSPVPPRLQHLWLGTKRAPESLVLHRGELEDVAALRTLVQAAKPDELYHLASQSHVGLSFEKPEATCEVIALGTIRFLELARALKPVPKFFHASSAQIFGQPKQVPQDEATPVAPLNPYACAKAFATQMTVTYRKSFGLFASNGILFNHESPRRGENFVTRKICRAAAAIRLGLQFELVLGDLEAQRDWGHARDYVEGMWLALQHDAPEDFVFATGQLHSVQDVVEVAFGQVHLNWKDHVRVDPALSRPADPHLLLGNASKAQRLLGWKPKVTFEALISEMTQSELAELSRT